MGESAGLAAQQLRALGRLSELLDASSHYLAGGSALAVHLAHRRSVDLDLFTRSEDVDLSELRRRLSAVFDGETSETDATLRGTIGGVPVDIVRYPYPLLEPPALMVEGMPVAGLRDLAAMKLAAISKRGLRRDFWDLHEITRRSLTLEAALSAYQERFRIVSPEPYHTIRALTYFGDAETDPIFPAGLSPERWESIKADFRREVPRLLSP